MVSILFFEGLLGKNVSEVKVFSKELRQSTPNMYYGVSDVFHYFYGKPYNHVVFYVNDNSIIESINISMLELIDKDFYTSFTKDFGEPKSIQVVDTSKVLSKKTTIDDGISTKRVQKNFITTRNGTFDDKPLYMIWEKENFHIKILMEYSNNRSNINIKIPSRKTF